jgi:hypothetical protein
LYSVAVNFEVSLPFSKFSIHGREPGPTTLLEVCVDATCAGGTGTGPVPDPTAAGWARKTTR